MRVWSASSRERRHAISKGTAGTHHVEGIGTSFVPPLFDASIVDEVRAIDEARRPRDGAASGTRRRDLLRHIELG